MTIKFDNKELQLLKEIFEYLENEDIFEDFNEVIKWEEDELKQKLSLLREKIVSEYDENECPNKHNHCYEMCTSCGDYFL